MKQITLPDLKRLEGSDEKIPIRLAVNTNSDWPVVLSLWFTCIDGKIYCATQENAKIVSFLRDNPKCAFEIASDNPPYKGFRGKGIAAIGKKNSREILLKLIKKYIPKKNTELEKSLLEKIDQEVTIEINPIKLVSWDYSDRMRNSV